MNFSFLGKMFILLGLFIVVTGIIIIFVSRIPGLGKLPGDIYIQKKNFSFYFPITSCLLISFIISLLLIFLRKK